MEVSLFRSRRHRRFFRNRAEQAFLIEVQQQGWEASKRGWPDFFCVRGVGGNEIMLVEVKSRRDVGLSRDQFLVLTTLARFGIPCYCWVDGVLERISAGTKPVFEQPDQVDPETEQDTDGPDVD